MAYVIVTVAALIVAGLTLYTGFGLGSLLMPAFALFFPVEVAVAATAVVHLANNLFKLFLVGKWAKWDVVGRFGIPAALAAFVGALLLTLLAEAQPLYEYTVAGQPRQITVIKLVIAVLIGAFTIFELAPNLNERFRFGEKALPVGGVLSGFFGGFSGHQGALRTVFLARLGLDKRAFLGTVAVTAAVVDVARLLVYGPTVFLKHFRDVGADNRAGLVVAATVAAFAGSFIASRYIHKVTMQTIHRVVGVMLLLLAVALGAGFV